LRRVPRRSLHGEPGHRDYCPGSARAGHLGIHAETRIARPDYHLVAMLDTDLIEDAADVVSNRFLREAKRRGNLPIIEAVGNTIEDGALPRRKFYRRTSRSCRG